MRRPCARQRQRHDHPHNRVMTKSKPLPPLEELKQFLDCDPETGIVSWKTSRGKKIKAGQEAGCVDNHGYIKIVITINEKKRSLSAHRLIWYITTGVDPVDFEIDHIDGNRSNNKIKNLRLASGNENLWNQKRYSNNTSGFKGVSFAKRHKKWTARIACNGKSKDLGYFPTPELAHMAYCKAAAELHGDFARGT